MPLRVCSLHRTSGGRLSLPMTTMIQQKMTSDMEEEYEEGLHTDVSLRTHTHTHIRSYTHVHAHTHIQVYMHHHTLAYHHTHTHFHVRVHVRVHSWVSISSTFPPLEGRRCPGCRWTFLGQAAPMVCGCVLAPERVGQVLQRPHCELEPYIQYPRPSSVWELGD